MGIVHPPFSGKTVFGFDDDEKPSSHNKGQWVQLNWDLSGIVGRVLEIEEWKALMMEMDQWKTKCLMTGELRGQMLEGEWSQEEVEWADWFGWISNVAI